ncbi:MAG: poly-gamma-glutamate system protein [Myxococcales bacterium]|jgi:poly-gamma-glutamate system protein
MASFDKVYWQNKSTPAGAQLLLILASVAALLAVQVFKKRESTGDYEDMLAASQTCSEGLELIGRWRRRIERIDPKVDPLRTGVIGVAASPVTSVSGHLPSKQATVNPNWAAVIVRLLRKAGVREGDVVAVAVSGSFPALNLAAYCALEQVGARPIIIASASASQWGANVPGLIWLDMARRLRAAGVIDSKAVAATLGGEDDRGVGIPEQGLSILQRAIERADIELLEPESYDEAVAERIAVYAKEAGEQPVRAFLNVGGGTATTGPASIDQFFDPGLLTGAPPRAFTMQSVMGHFIDQEVPVINLWNISTLASRFGLPYPPTEKPRVGEGGIYRATTYRRWLAALLALALLALTYFLTRSAGLGSVFGRSKAQNNPAGPAV